MSSVGRDGGDATERQGKRRSISWSGAATSSAEGTAIPKLRRVPVTGLTRAEDGFAAAYDHSHVMNTEFTVTCPYCGEELEIYVEPDVRGSFVQDCAVCCNPWRLRVVHEGGERHIEVARADGSE